MQVAERYFIAPTDDELQVGLWDLLDRHASVSEARRWRPEPDFFPAILRAVNAGLTGETFHDVAKLESAVFVLRLLWAGDYARRRHYRVQLFRLVSDGTARSKPPTLGKDEQPAAHVYAPHLYRFSRESYLPASLVLGCSCGAVGTVDEIAWMGDRCGPCHDRSEAGEPLPLPLARHQRSPLHPKSGGILGRTLAVLPDGRHALTLRHRPTGEDSPVGPVLQLWNLDEQRSLQEWPLPERNIGVNVSPDGGSLGIIHPHGNGIRLMVYEGPGCSSEPAPTPRVQCEIPGETRCFTLPPGATTVYLGNMRELVVVDLTQTPPQHRSWFAMAEEPLDLACTRDGRWLAACWRESGLMLIDRATGQTHARFAMRSSRGVLAFTPDSRLLFVCDAEAIVWIFEMPTLNLVGRFQTRPWTVHGLDVCGPWLALQGLTAGPVEFWPWEVLVDYARPVACRHLSPT